MKKIILIVKDYFNDEINERKNIIKKSNKYTVTLDYLDKIFITLSASFNCTCNCIRYTTWYYWCFFNFIIYNKYRNK